MVERRLIAVEGVVQGVGFRPYVHRLAAANAVRGLVRNDAGGVHIDVEGDTARIAEFCRALTASPPGLATIESVRVEQAPPQAYQDFSIAPSLPTTPDSRAVMIPPDVATCDACLAELFDPSNRRFGHPFITCTACGPRLTIMHETPYDRERTTMSAFRACERCIAEYEDPNDRRFHAESIACPECGPTLVASGAPDNPVLLERQAALDAAVATLLAGGIVAIKALGGFNLACDATDRAAVDRLRNRKQRPSKPFAVMVRDARDAPALGSLTPVERAALSSPARPVVLLTRRPGVAVAAPVAPGTDMLGVMLPSTPLHHLLMAAVNRPLVMTSGNRGGDPVEIEDTNAGVALGGIADLFLGHDRRIVTRCDDSVVRVVAGEMRQVRRSRGHAPRIITLPFAVPAPVLAVGGHLKNTVCVATGTAAHLSPHVGDLDSHAAREALRHAITVTLRMARARPRVIAHDLHPEYASTRVAELLAVEEGIMRRVPVQHHHAHVAACVAEYGVRDPVIGVVFDGAGLGTDGAIWGGEFLVVDGARFVRCGHLAYVPLPGGDAAARQPWRCAASHVARLHSGARAKAADRPSGVTGAEWRVMHQLIARPEPATQTSSVGRLFDAVASLLGLCHIARHEGEAAMAVESISGPVVTGYPVALTGGAPWTADPASIIHGVVDDLERRREPSEIAAKFHGALRDLIVAGCERIREESGLTTVVLGGGVFVNRVLAEAAHAALIARRFHVLLPRQVPCNDGGLSLGQAYVAGCALREEPCA